MEVVVAYESLLSISNLSFENEGRLRTALRAVKKGADLADELIVAKSREHGCRDFASFDKGIVKRHDDAFSPKAD